MLTLRPGRNGFTLIEVLVTVVIVGLLLMAGISSVNEWLNNLRVRSTAEAVLDGLQLSRNEAIKRNVPVTFTLNAGTGWSITVFTTGTVLQQRPNAEQAGNISRTVANASTSITFDGFGRIWAPSATTGWVVATPIDQIDFSNPAVAAANQRALRVTIANPGGEIRMCDPAVTDAGDPRKC